MRPLLVVIGVLCSVDQAVAACTRHTLSSPALAATRSLWICDTAAEMPSSGFAPGDVVIAVDTSAIRVARTATTVFNPDVGAGPSGSTAWADITEKPATFPPTIGPGAADAVAGNDSRLADARTPIAHAHAIANVTNLQATIDGKAATVHAHAVADVTNLQATLDAKASAVHVHAISDVTNLTASLAAKADTAHTHAGIPTILRVAANVANSTTNFADVTGLTMAVASGQTYRFECNLSYTTAATTTALQLAVNGPSMTALDYEVVTYTAATALHAAAQTAVDTVTNAATGGGATRLPARVSGSFIPSANGTFAVRLRSEVNASAATVMRGGWCAVY